MRQIILNSPKQLEQGLTLGKDIKVKGKFDKIIVCGMGGSGQQATILTTCLPGLKIPVFSYKSYGLPTQATKKTLIVAVSYSGNTEETISVYEEAIKKGLKVLAITTGGKLKELSEKNKQPIAIIPKDADQPRFALSYQAAVLFKILANSGIIEDKSKEILETAKRLNPAQSENEGKELAKKLVDKIPVIYASDRLKALARIWKNKFNENAKIMAFWNYFPELNHNEMVGLTNLKGNFHFIIIKDEDDHPRVQKRMQLFADLAKERDASVDFIMVKGENIMEKLWSGSTVGDWVTYYLAREYGQDPTPVKIVEEFKKRLNE